MKLLLIIAGIYLIGHETRIIGPTVNAPAKQTVLPRPILLRRTGVPAGGSGGGGSVGSYSVATATSGGFTGLHPILQPAP